ncbi:hypothetical protein CR105_16245 [Massilia eurypsychrophila]|jgi:hypothetical protein|uniref:DUF3304 domain-containing protein n=1 Tax=Massilia eurypsychrophila TaxID=1485217 RepID=A0A2G8TE35_9BURK|nr:DUF3304 domain-containing protein [Massilia eurypsychrophila]PIL43898.1 hypothetical protein CR105_16245 [Massilia eurypsychrophila]
MKPHQHPSIRLRRPFSQLVIALVIVLGSSIPLASTALEAKRTVPAGTRLSLALVGYNYTSRYIDTFSVNGQGGGNLYVSSPTSGGGGAVCCVSYVQGRPMGEVTIRWQSGGCTFRAPGPMADGRTHLAHSFFREIRVKVDPRLPDDPQEFEVHFYPDGHVEAAITDGSSSPRLVYSKGREDRSEFPRCPNEKEPKK